MLHGLSLAPFTCGAWIVAHSWKDVLHMYTECHTSFKVSKNKHFLASIFNTSKKYKSSEVRARLSVIKLDAVVILWQFWDWRKLFRISSFLLQQKFLVDFFKNLSGIISFFFLFFCRFYLSKKNPNTFHYQNKMILLDWGSVE